jgi:hypothetical protein
MQASDSVADSECKWQQQLVLLQQAKAAGEAALSAAHAKALTAQEQALWTEFTQQLATAEAAHTQQLQQLEHQLAASRALASTTEDSAAQHVTRMKQHLEQEQAAVLDLQQQLQDVQDQLQQASLLQQEADAMKVSNATTTTSTTLLDHGLA